MEAAVSCVTLLSVVSNYMASLSGCVCPSWKF